MAINNARKFVEKLKEDHSFRDKVLETTEPEDLFLFLKEERLTFNQRELVGVMADCMKKLEQHQGS